MSDEDFGYLIWSSTDWIKWACYYALKELPEGTDLSDIRLFAQRILSPAGPSEIVTLNHDLHLDDAIAARGVAGFSNTRPSTFHPDHLQPNGNRLLKLHGSIDWFRSRENNQIKRIAEPSEFEVDDGPLVLSGTISKLEDYNYGPFPWLWAEFQNALRTTRRLVICGYGFKDLGINSRLTDWLNHYPDARIRVLHRYPDRLMDDCAKEPLGGICNFFDEASTEGFDNNTAQIAIAPHWFAEASRSPVAEQILRFVHA